MSSQQTLDELNEAARYKPLYHFDDIRPNVRYIVKSLSKIDETEFGTAILMVSEDFRIYLPKRLAALTDEKIDEINKLAERKFLYMVYLGKCGRANIVRFEEEGEDESFWGRYKCLLNTQIAYENKREINKYDK